MSAIGSQIGSGWRLPSRVRLLWLPSVVLAVGLYGYPLVSFLTLSGAADTRAVTMPYRAIYLLLSLGALALRKKRHLGITLVEVLLLVFSILYLLRIAHETIYSSPLSRPISDVWMLAIGTCLVPALATRRALVTEESANLTLWLTFSLSSAVALLLWWFSPSSSAPAVRGIGNDAFGPLALGYFGSSAMTLSLYMILRPRGRIGPKVCAIAVAVLSASAIARAGSRGPIIGLALSSVGLVYSLWRQGRSRRVLLIVCVCAVAGTVFLDSLVQLNAPVLQRFLMTRERVETQSEGRIGIWLSALSFVAESPISGVALEDPVTRFHPHNGWVEAFLATGVVGGFLFALATLALVWRILDMLHVDSVAWVALLLINHFCYSAFSGALYSHGEMWCLIAAVAGWRLVPSRRSEPSMSSLAVVVAPGAIPGKNKRIYIS